MVVVFNSCEFFVRQPSDRGWRKLVEYSVGEEKADFLHDLVLHGTHLYVVNTGGS